MVLKFEQRYLKIILTFSIIPSLGFNPISQQEMKNILIPVCDILLNFKVGFF